MPTRPNAACSVCSEPVYRSSTSRPEIVCLECRRKQPRTYKNRQAGQRPSKYQPRPCDVCGKIYQPVPRTRGKPPQRYCSKSCATSAGNRARAGTLNLSPEQWQERQKARVTAKNRKRRMRLNAAPWDGVTDETILERDRWTCRMPACIYGSRRISKTRKFPDKRSASIDHILPLSFGGDDTQYNKRAAHLGCNVMRNTQLDDQMPLAFGADLDAIPRFYQQPTPRRPRSCPVCGEPYERGGCPVPHALVRWCQDCGKSIPDARSSSTLCKPCREQRAASRAERQGARQARVSACVAKGCGRRIFVSPLCAPHFHRLDRHGDIFEDIPIARNRAERLKVGHMIQARVTSRQSLDETLGDRSVTLCK